MEPNCELCTVKRAVIYCKRDKASLCIMCDGLVHSANFISSRHVRSLLCDKCNCEPAEILCSANQTCLCKNCESDHSLLCFEHQHQNLPLYSGNPSLEELKETWSCFLGSHNSTRSHSSTSCFNSDSDRKSEDSTRRLPSCIPHPPEPFRFTRYNLGKEKMDLKKIDEVYNSPHCCVNPFPIGEDVDSKLEPQRITKPSSLDAKSSKGHFENTKNDFSHVADHLGSMSANDKQPKNPRKSRSVNLNFPSKQIQSNACVTEYQDCKLSPVVLKGNPTYGKWRTRSSQARDEAKRRYNKKKKNRKYGKEQIRYPSRSNRAENRQREKEPENGDTLFQILNKLRE